MPLRRKSEKSGSSSNVSKGSEEEWKEVQLRVYTNWVNDKLQAIEEHVSSLPKELENGLILIKLLEFLSGKKIRGK